MKRLGDDTAGRVLARHDLLEPGEELTTKDLSGGVSSAVVLCETPRERYVLKQPMPEFAVAERWIVDTVRAKVEYEVGRFLHTYFGRHIIQILAYDHVDDILVMKAAPRGWKTWKEHMLKGEVRPETGRSAGRLLAGIHALGQDLDDPMTFRHDDLFREQRIDPYFVTAAQREPAAKERLEDLSARFFERFDLVHGDFSPKNLFTDPAMAEVRLIDHEVATRGDAAFDLGFCLTHLVMKGVHLPNHRAVLHETATTLLQVYQDARPDDERDPLYAREERALAWLGACLLARAVGKSRAEYLTEGQRERVRKLGLSILDARPKRLDAALQMAREIGD